MKTIIKKFSRKKLPIALGLVVLILAAGFLLPRSVLAAGIDIADYIASGLGHLALGIVNMLGSLVLLPLINFVVWILSYNDFLNNNAVIVGWPLVRDLCNMFFVIILLLIAFGTILNISNYSYKSTFFKLILMAVLINFSKTIMGFAIDFMQVIMLTFVSAFRDAAAVNLIHAFGIRDMLKLDMQQDTFNNWEVVGVALLGVILLVISIGLMVAYAAVLLWRIISLWVLVILSPLAFLLSAVPAGQKYASEIWSKFVEQLTTGVILAFFMWLFFSILAAGYSVEKQAPVAEAVLSSGSAAINSGAAGSGQQRTSAGGQANISEDVQWSRLYTFIIAVALLMLALQYAQKAGGFAGSFAGKVSGKMSALGVGTAKVIGSPLLGAYALSKWGVKSIPKKLDQEFVKLQKKGKLGEKLKARPLSLRPSVIKEAFDRYSKEREKQYYTGVSVGMTDQLLKNFAHRKTDYAGMAYDARVHEVEKEIGAGGETQEQMRAYLIEDHLQKYTTKDADGNEVEKYKVKAGHEVEVEAILGILTKNHDLNEIFKDHQIGKSYNNLYSAIDVVDLMKDLFVDQGEEWAARVAKDTGIIGFENKDAHLYGMAAKNVHTDEFEFFKKATRDQKGDKRLINNVGHLVKGDTEEEKQNYLKQLRSRADQGDKSAQKEYRELLREDWTAAQGALATAFMLKKGGRAGLGKITAQNIVNESVLRYQEDVTDEDGVIHKKGDVMLDEDNETSRSFLTYDLNETGKGIIEKMALVMTKEYSHLIDETKIYGIAPALDTILKFAEDQKLAVERLKIMKFAAKASGMDDKSVDDLFKKMSAVGQEGSGFKSDVEYKNFKEGIVKSSQEARLVSQKDARHARIDKKTGEWKQDKYSVFEEYENTDLTYKNGSNGNTTPPSVSPSAPTPPPGNAPKPTPGLAKPTPSAASSVIPGQVATETFSDEQISSIQQKSKEKKNKLTRERGALDNKKDQLDPAFVQQEQTRIIGETKLIDQITQLNDRLEALTVEIGRATNDADKNKLSQEKTGVEKKGATSIITTCVNNVQTANPLAFKSVNWMKDPKTRLMFLTALRGQFDQVKDLDEKLFKNVMGQIKVSFINSDDAMKNLTEDFANEDEINGFLGKLNE